MRRSLATLRKWKKGLMCYLNEYRWMARGGQGHALTWSGVLTKMALSLVLFRSFQMVWTDDGDGDGLQESGGLMLKYS